MDQQLSADLEWVQMGLDAIEALPPDKRALLSYTEWYLRQRKAALEREIP